MSMGRLCKSPRMLIFPRQRKSPTWHYTRDEQIGQDEDEDEGGRKGVERRKGGGDEEGRSGGTSKEEEGHHISRGMKPAHSAWIPCSFK